MLTFLKNFSTSQIVGGVLAGGVILGGLVYIHRRYNRDADDLDPEEVRTLHFNDRYESSTDPESEPEPASAMLDLPMGDAPEIEENYPEASTVALAGIIARL
ncbi:hypothetical protein J6590_004008 [Homalodisca vitripennis]|nr:hypothetical protein J6590_004008 [Homalodisca vitripennis]